GLANIVQAVQQKVLAERIDFKRNLLPARSNDNLALQIDRYAGVAAELGVLDQGVADLARQADRQDAVLEAVVEENIGEVRRDDAANAEIQQRPGGVLARRAATKVLVRDNDLRLAVRLLVQNEIGVFRTVLVEAQRVEQMDPEAGALDGLEEARRDDLVGVDVLHRHRRSDGGQGGEG